MNMYIQYLCNEEDEQQRKRSEFNIAQNIHECPILDKNIQYTLSKNKTVKNEDTVLSRKKNLF